MPCALNIHSVDDLITKHVVLCHQCHGLYHPDKFF